MNNLILKVESVGLEKWRWWLEQQNKGTMQKARGNQYVCCHPCPWCTKKTSVHMYHRLQPLLFISSPLYLTFVELLGYIIFLLQRPTSPQWQPLTIATPLAHPIPLPRTIEVHQAFDFSWLHGFIWKPWQWTSTIDRKKQRFSLKISAIFQTKTPTVQY